MTRDEMIEIKAVVRRTMEENMEMYSEVWLTKDDVCKVFGSLKPAWLDRYWPALHAMGCVKQPMVIDERGEAHRSPRLFARNKIQRLFASGEIEHLACQAVVD